MICQENRNLRRGFTLLEVILALGLAAVLLSIVGMAVDTYWRAHARGRKSVENAQLARALLAQIADDLRSTVVTPPDYSSACAELAENLQNSIKQIESQSQPAAGSQSGGGDQGNNNQGGGGQSGGGQGGGRGRGQGGGNPAGGGPGGNNPGGPGGGGPPGGDRPDSDGPPTDGTNPPPPDPDSRPPVADGASNGGRGGFGGSGSGGGSRGGNATGGSGGMGRGSSGGTGGMNGGMSNGGSATAGNAATTTGSVGQTTVLPDTTQTTETPLLAPKMYGSQYELQIDISRPLRPDQLRVLGATPPGASTLQYRLDDPQAFADSRQFADGGGLSALPQSTTSTIAALGLVRQESNRVLFAAGSNTTRSGQDLSRPDVLAPEVAGLEFRYFNGTEWLSEWDSDIQQAMPTAIEVSLMFRVPQSRTGLFAWNAPVENELVEQHRMVVRLPNESVPSTSTAATNSNSGSTNPSMQAAPASSSSGLGGGQGR